MSPPHGAVKSIALEMLGTNAAVEILQLLLGSMHDGIGLSKLTLQGLAAMFQVSLHGILTLRE